MWTLKIHPDRKFIDSIEGFTEWSKDKKSLGARILLSLAKKKICLLMEDGKPLGESGTLIKKIKKASQN